MFLVVLLILVIVFYPYTENFVDIPSIKKLQKDFDNVFTSSHKSIKTEPDNYMFLYNNLNN
jgi:hypothetical protein